jgi:hypothetical protein
MFQKPKFSKRRTKTSDDTLAEITKLMLKIKHKNPELYYSEIIQLNDLGGWADDEQLCENLENYYKELN